MSEAILDVTDLTVRYPIRSSVLRKTAGYHEAVRGVSFTVQPGQTLALVGESGCGKSSTARAIIGLERISGGSVTLQGKDITSVTAAERRRLTRQMQIVFQDPYASLNPRLTVRQILQEGWRIHPDLVPRDRRDEAVEELLTQVGLNAKHAERYPHQFSGGQRQRIGIARALSMRPQLIVLDEPVSALDVSVQAQILNLLAELQAELGLAYLFISHDLQVVRHISDEIAVMYNGVIVEHGDSAGVFADPQHDYTRELLAAAPVTFPWRKGGSSGTPTTPSAAAMTSR